MHNVSCIAVNTMQRFMCGDWKHRVILTVPEYVRIDEFDDTQDRQDRLTCTGLSFFLGEAAPGICPRGTQDGLPAKGGNFFSRIISISGHTFMGYIMKEILPEESEGIR